MLKQNNLMNNINRAFILGNPRSGTTLFRLLLNAHSRIVAPPESGFLQWWFAKYGGYSPAMLHKEGYLNTLLDDLLSSKKIEGWSLSRAELADSFIESPPSDYAALCERLYRLHASPAKRDSLQWVVDKNNYYIHHLETILEAWPKAFAFFSVRDGRDVACSYLKINELDSRSPYKPKLPSSILEIAEEWRSNNLKVADFLTQHFPGRHVVLRYEDLIREPAQVLERVLRPLGLDFEPAMLKFYQHNDEPESTMDWKQKTKGALDAGNAGRYKELLDDAQLEAFESIAGDVLRKYNYL